MWLIFDEQWMGTEAVCGVIPFLLLSFSAEAFLIRVIHRTKRSSRRRNLSGKRSGFVRKKSINRRRSVNGTGGRRRSLSMQCVKKWSGFNMRRGIGLLLGVVAVCGVYAVRVHPCARVPQREGAREQVRRFLKLNYTSPLVLCMVEQDSATVCDEPATHQENGKKT